MNTNVPHFYVQAMEKVEIEYKKYKEKTLSDVEKDYLDSIRLLENISKDD